MLTVYFSFAHSVVMRINRIMIKTKRATNLSLPTGLVEVAESYASANGRNMSELVAQLLREFLEEKSIPCEADIETVIRELQKRLSSKDTKRQLEEASEKGEEYLRAKGETKKAARRRAA